MKYLGLDAGSISVKFVLLGEGGGEEKLRSGYVKHGGHPLKAALEMLEPFAGLEDICLSITGSNGRLLAGIFGLEPLNEVVAQAYSTRKLHPGIKSIIELGGEDSKLIILNPEGIEDFSMNSVCAAGTGSFLDQQAERLRFSIEEFSELALRSEKPPRIAGRCSVFAKSDMIHLQQIATPVEDIVAGLCFAVARNFKGSILRGRKVLEPVSFQGGVAANRGMVRAFKEVLGLKELFVPEDFALMGAWGAALKLRESGAKNPPGALNRFRIEELREFMEKEKEKSSAGGHRALLAPATAPSDKTPGAIAPSDENLLERHRDGPRLGEVPAPMGPAAGMVKKKKTYLGIDIGSISTNLALIDEDSNLLAKRYLMTAGRPIEAVMTGLREISAEIGDTVEVAGCGTTGSGRYMIADYVGADIVKNEITAQATAAVEIDPGVDTIFEIGGQDSKYISLRDGVIVDFEMNKACAAGTGSFLEEQAEKLRVSVKEEFARCAFTSSNPLRLGERCTVFMENSLMANLGKGAKKNDLLAGLAYSIVQNYINRVVAGKPIGGNIFFQGGVAFNKAVVAAFESYLGKPVTVPAHHDVTGAIGMAMIAMRHMLDRPEKGKSSFKGFKLYERSYSVDSFQCKGCPNVCEINRVKIKDEKNYLFYGGRCEKYDIRKKPAGLPNLFKFREDALWKAHTSYLEKNKKAGEGGVARLPLRRGTARPKIGIPYIFSFHDQLPFWSVFLWECGFEVEVSPRTNREVINTGLESVLSEGCFPLKVAHGHIKHLMGKGVDKIFLPSFINLNPEGSEIRSGHGCPETQTIPYVARVALEGLKLITFPVDLSRGRHYLIKNLKKALRDFSLSGAVIGKALRKAEEAQLEFERAIAGKGLESLGAVEALRERAVVIMGRAYNAFDPGVNLEIPEKLASLGVFSIPMDFLPLEQERIGSQCPQMYWRSGQRILKAAKAIKENNYLYPIFIGNFLCGPDSFIIKYLKKELGSKEKPFLHIEIDEHSADAGAITRCEAFLDSIEGRRKTAGREALEALEAPAAIVVKNVSAERRRKVYVPRMSDHAFAIQAAFEKMGVRAEVLPPSDQKTLEYGERFVSGKECYPYLVTTGDMLKKVYSAGFNPEESAFFMPSGTGPCRFGQYNVFHKQVLESIGLADVPVFAPNQDTTFYRDLGVVGNGFAINAWKGIIAVELLVKCLHESRPYEAEPGAAERLYNEHLERLCKALRVMNGPIEDVLKDARKDFSGLPLAGGGGKRGKPIVGIVGEIFVRSNKFSNDNLVKKIEALGGEAWLAPVEEWIYYVNRMGLRKSWMRKDRRALRDYLITDFVQKRIEHKYRSCFKGFLRTVQEPETSRIMRKAAPYVHDSFEGETILSVGKSVDLAERGVSGIVNAMPFGCMPGTIVTALLRGISRDFNLPALSMPYEGTESPTSILQLEAFMDQARGRRRQKARQV